MNRHTQELYRLAELPAFIEEAWSNRSMEDLIAFYKHGDPDMVMGELENMVVQYAEQWVDEWMSDCKEPLFDSSNRDDDPEIRAIEAGVKLFSNPDCKAGLPE